MVIGPSPKWHLRGVLVSPADGGVHGPADVVSTIGRCQERGEEPFQGAVHGHLSSRL
ncbi:hypothetical protein SGLAM104S_00035 [Streptomyces glaucescens]